MSLATRLRAAGLLLPALVALSAPAPAAASANGFQGRLWAQKLDGPGGGADTPYDMALSPDGATVFVTGTVTASPTDPGDYLTVAYDAKTGSKRWIARYNDPGNGDDGANGLVVSPDGATVFVAGTSTHGSGSDYTTIAYDAATGQGRWIAHYQGNGAYNFGYAIAISPDGSKVFVSGEASGGQNTVAYDAATGAQLWPAPPRQRASGSFVALALAVSPDSGTVYATGFVTSGSVYDYETVAYDAASGSVTWVSTYNGPGNSQDDATAIAVSPDGSRVIVTGSSWDISRDYATVAYDASTGSQLWVSRYDGPGQAYDDAWDLALSPDGSTVFVTGDSMGAGSDYAYATIAYDSTSGAQSWVSRYDGANAAVDTAYSVRPSPDGATVYVTGSSDSAASGLSYATVSYDALTGADDGVVVALNGEGGTVRVSPDGTAVFVTGSQGGAVNTTTTNYGTIAYLVGP